MVGGRGCLVGSGWKYESGRGRGAADQAAQASEDAVELEIQLDGPFAQIRGLRTGQQLSAGNTIHSSWKPWEGLPFELR